MKRRLFLSSASATLAAGLAGCSGGSSQGGSTPTSTATPASTPTASSTTPTATTQTEPKTFDLDISHYPIISTAVPVIVCNDKGLYAKRHIGIDKITSFSGAGTAVRGVLTGGMPLGAAGAPAVAKAWKAGAPINYVGGLANTNDIDVVVPADSEIETIQDLKGKSIGYTQPGSSSQAMIVMSLKRADGISLDDVTLKAMGGLGETITGLKQGAIDAGWSNVVVSIPQIDQGNWRRIFGTWEYAPEIPNTVFFAGTQTIKENADFFKRFLEAHIEANQIIKNDTAYAGQAWAKHNDNLDATLAQKVIEIDLSMSDNFFGVGWNKGAFSSLQEMMMAVNTISTPVDWQSVVDQEFIPTDKRISLPGLP